MCSPTLALQATSMTTSVVFLASSGIRSNEEEEEKFHPLHMDWVLVAEKDGKPRPRMNWAVD